MGNIFENAYFGKPYKTRDNRKAIFIDKFEDGDPFTLRYPYVFHVENTRPDSIIYYNSKGNTKNINTASIVSEWHEEICEEELDELATKNTIADLGYEFDSHDYTDHSGRNAHWSSYREGWKAAYRKAIKEYGSK